MDVATDRVNVPTEDGATHEECVGEDEDRDADAHVRRADCALRENPGEHGDEQRDADEFGEEHRARLDAQVMRLHRTTRAQLAEQERHDGGDADHQGQDVGGTGIPQESEQARVGDADKA